MIDVLEVLLLKHLIEMVDPNNTYLSCTDLI